MAAPHPTAVILVVGLTRNIIGSHTPHLLRLAREGEVRDLVPVLPAVTCSVQASMLTGLPVTAHGIVGNGWYNRELDEVHFWKQSNRLVAGEKIWETARRRDAKVTTANICWWFNMCSSVDYSVTPRPVYTADGRKIPDCASQPLDLRDRLQAELGQFPLFKFWGPGAAIESTRWIAGAAMRVLQWHKPTLSLVYLPHLDYSLQRDGPGSRMALRAATEVDAVIGDLVATYESRDVRWMIVSEYAIQSVTVGGGAIRINRVLRDGGFLRVRVEQGREMLDTGGSAAFAVADHQVAHIYVREPGLVEPVRALLGAMPGIDRCLNRGEQAAAQIDHARSGDLVAVAAAGRWFSYGWWSDDARAPDYARTVDIHRKPGYDPLELHLDPRLPLPRLTVARKLLLRRLGFRTLLDVIPLDPSLVKGTHGRVDGDGSWPMLLTQRDRTRRPERLPCTVVRDVILEHLFS